MSRGFEVMARKCDQCLLSAERIVTAERATEILRECAERDNHFLCHKGTMAGRDIGCRGHFDTMPGKVARFAAMLGVVIEIDPQTLEPIVRDSGSGSQSEDAPQSAAEAEASQSGVSASERIAQSPQPIEPKG